MKPLITVAIPVFNGEKFLLECVESLDQSGLENCEVLFVDDVSSDNSISIIADYIKNHDLHGQWRIEKNKKNLGLTGNWNRCCELATGDWIMFLFQDDFLEKNAILHRINLINNYPYSLFISDRNYVFDADLELKKRAFFEVNLKKLRNYFNSDTFVDQNQVANLFVDNFLGQNIIGEPIVGIFKKELLDRYGYFNTRLKQICDYEFWLRIGLNEGFFFHNQKIVNFRVHTESTTRKNAAGKLPISKIDRVILGSDLLEKSYYNWFRTWYSKQPYKDSLREVYRRWCYKNVRLNRHFFEYKDHMDNANFKLDLNFLYHKLKDRLQNKLDKVI